MDKELFVAYLDERAGGSFKMNPLFDVCIDATLEQKRLTGPDRRLIQPTPRWLLSTFEGTVKSLLLSFPPTGSLSFRGVRVQDYLPIREQLLSQLDLLTAEDED